jgi:predicted amidohydrolase YtcJ
MDVFPGGTPHADTLDALVADRPAFLPNRDGHGAWVNSRALEVAGITRDTPDPADGRIERDADGTPTGTLHEGAMDLVVPHLPEPTHEELIGGLLTAQEYLHSLGITAWQDALVDSLQWGWNLPAYIETARDGRLTARVVGALWWERHRGEEQIAELIDKRAQAEGLERFRATSVKIMQDGVCENSTAAMIDPYVDADGNPTDDRGPSLVEPDALNSAVTRLDAEGFQGALPHDRGPRRARGARCDRGGPERQRPERPSPPPLPHPGRASRRHPTVPHPARGGERAALVGGARGTDGRPHDPVPG